LKFNPNRVIIKGRRTGKINIKFRKSRSVCSSDNDKRGGDKVFNI